MSTSPSQKIAFGDCDYWQESICRNLAPHYKPHFIDLARARFKDFDAVIPLQIRHYPALERHPQLRGSKFFHPSPHTISLCDDKLQLTQFLIAEGLANYVPALRSSGPPYPYVWKKRISWWGQDCHIVAGQHQERDLDLTGPDYFAQEVTTGEVEFATHILRVDGVIRYVSTFAHKMARPLFVNGVQDKPLHSTFFRGCHYLDIFSSILARLQFEGTACIDYKVVAGKPIIFEINPRFGGSLCADVTAYLDAYLASLTPQSMQQKFRSTLLRIKRRLPFR
jgi:hypothetical protein